MTGGRLRSQAGFTYIAALFIVVLMGVMLGMVGETWKMIMQRDREEELLYRGKQIKTAIDRYQKAGQLPVGGLKGLDILYKGDDRLAGRTRYLRKDWKDPITGKDWLLIKDPVKGIIGVASPSEQEPLKKANFPEEFSDFDGKTTYKEWQFSTAPKAPANRPGQSGKAGQPGQAGQIQLHPMRPPNPQQEIDRSNPPGPQR